MPILSDTKKVVAIPVVKVNVVRASQNTEFGRFTHLRRLRITVSESPLSSFVAVSWCRVAPVEIDRIMMASVLLGRHCLQILGSIVPWNAVLVVYDFSINSIGTVFSGVDESV